MKLRHVTILGLFMILIVPSISGTVLLSNVPNSSFILADDWNQTGNATLQLDTGEWNQAGNATLYVETPPDLEEIATNNFTFAQTIDDDILHYPDVGDIVTGGNVSGTETNDYTYMSEDDSNYWQVTAGNYMYFDIEDCIASQVYISYSALSSFPTGKILYLYLYNPNGADLLVDSATGVGGSDAVMDEDLVLIDNWMDYSNFGNHTFYFTSTQNHVLAYYFHVDLYNDSSQYYESFADVSDYSVWTGNAPSSDGDVLTVDCVGGGSYTRLWTDVSFSSLEGYYVEFRVWTNISISWVRIFGYTGDAHTGTEFGIGSYCYSWTAGTWITWKALVTSSNAVESFAIVAIRNTAGDFQLKIDYLRIAPSDEFGWSHDGSTTEGLTAADETNFDYIFSSDGDVLTINTTVDTGSSYNGDTYLAYDTTSTAADLSATYYPFVHLRYKCYVDGGNYYVYFRYGGKTATLTLTTDNIWHDAYLNVAAGSSTSSANIILRYYRNVAGQTAMLQIETVQAYSIANYTFAQHASTPTTDYYYVVNGTLVREASAAWYMELNYDPYINVTTTHRSMANISISNLVSSGGSYDFGFYQYVSGSGEWVYDETNFTINTGFLTDFRIITYSDIHIANILFMEMPPDWYDIGTANLYFDTPEWVEIVEALLRFVIPWDEGMLTGWFMLLGAIMIPGSTIFLVLNRHSMNRDKVLAFFLMFVLGWGLLLMGVL